MNALEPVSGILGGRSMPACRLIEAGSIDALLDTLPEAGSVIGVVIGQDLLLVAPLHGKPRAQFSLMLAFADPRIEFGLLQRRWAWSAPLASRLEALVAALDPEEAVGCSDTGEVYIHLNGAFERRYYPTPTPATTFACRAADAARDCRLPTLHQASILRCFGPQSLQNAAFDRSPDRDCWYRSSHRLGVVGVGRGQTTSGMQLGAIFEFSERWAATWEPPHSVCESASTLGRRATRPDALWGISPGQAEEVFPGFHPDRSLPWIPARKLVSRESTLVPLELVHYLTRPSDPIMPRRTSSGCALGNAPDEAALFGALEVIERDALLLTWYTGSTPPRLDTASVECTVCREAMMLFKARGYETLCFDMTTEYRVPTVLTVLRGSARHCVALFVTACAHPDPEHALRASLAEAQSLLGIAERNYARHRARYQGAGSSTWIRSHEDQYLYYAYPEHSHVARFLTASEPCVTMADFRAAFPPAAQEPSWALKHLVAQVQSQGDEVVACFSTPPPLEALGLHAARTFVPGLINLAFGAKPSCIPEGRIQRAAARLPWVNSAPAFDDPPPHPLG